MTFGECLKFFDTYCDFCAIGMFLALVLFVICNLCKNVYAKQNKQFCRCIDSLLTNPNNGFSNPELLPQEYARQWRAYTNGKADKPSVVMEFVVVRCKPCLVWLGVLSVLAECCFGVAVVALSDNRAITLYFVTYLLLCVLAAVLFNHVYARRQKSARRLFAKFVALANKSCRLPQTSASVSDTIKRIFVLTRGQPDDKTLEKVAELLRLCSSDATRTAEQQRKLNFAVNGLLQAYANKLRFA